VLSRAGCSCGFPKGANLLLRFEIGIFEPRPRDDFRVGGGRGMRTKVDHLIGCVPLLPEWPDSLLPWFKDDIVIDVIDEDAPE
jgi:hypothetical protein